MYENSTESIFKAQNGNEECMSKLVENNKGLVWSIVKRFSGRGYELDDLYQIGSLGLVKAIKRFDTSLEVKLSTYAVPYILGEIKRFIRDDGPIKVSRSMKELGIKIKEIQKEYLNKYGKEINVEEISSILRISKEEIAQAIDSFNPVESIYDKSYSGDNEGVSILDKLSDNKNEANIIIDKICINELIESLEPREKQLILLRYYRGKTQCEVAKVLGITQVQVSRIEKRVLNSMKLKLAI